MSSFDSITQYLPGNPPTISKNLRLTLWNPIQVKVLDEIKPLNDILMEHNRLDLIQEITYDIIYAYLFLRL